MWTNNFCGDRCNTMYNINLASDWLKIKGQLDFSKTFRNLFVQTDSPKITTRH